ncbi:DUF397 domain-containing protein [Actinoallomurus vinaceus]
MQWRKSSHSGGVNDEACVEVAPVTWQEAVDLTAQPTADDNGR